LYVMKNDLGINRLGITVGKKFGKSVKRNRMKRLIRENYRLYEEFVKKGMTLFLWQETLNKCLILKMLKKR